MNSHKFVVGKIWQKHQEVGQGSHERVEHSVGVVEEFRSESDLAIRTVKDSIVSIVFLDINKAYCYKHHVDTGRYALFFLSLNLNLNLN